MRIAITGGSGFIGVPLVRALPPRGDDAAVLPRDPAHVEAGRAVAWSGNWQEEVASADAIVNLAGENVGGGRWTAERKRRIVESRVQVTQSVVDALKAQPGRKRVLVGASAIGFYGVRGDETLDEQASPGSGFLAGVVRRW